MAQLSIRTNDDIKQSELITNEKRISDDPFFDNPNNLRALHSGLEDSNNGRLVEHDIINNAK